MKHILDASALLAWLQGEPGAEMIEGVLSTAAISSLNWSEVYQKSLVYGVDVKGLRSDLKAVGLVILPFAAEDAERTAGLWKAGSGLSLADRACLALGMRYSVPVWTADRAWVQAANGVDVKVIRPWVIPYTGGDGNSSSIALVKFIKFRTYAALRLLPVVKRQSTTNLQAGLAYVLKLIKL
jgi:ribonuclease VapC